MKKTLGIISYSRESINLYYAQIRSLFSDKIKINKLNLNEIKLSKNIDADVILIPSYDMFQKIKAHIRQDMELIFANRTISKLALDKIMAIEEGTEIILIDESPEMTEQMISVLYQLGVRHIDLQSYWARNGDIADKTIMYLGQSAHVSQGAENAINIGNSLLDFNTIIDIGMKLNLTPMLNRQNIGSSYKEVKTANFGLAEIMGICNSRESQLDILLEIINAGVIGINPDGIIFLYNKHAEDILGYEEKQALNMNGLELLTQIPFRNVLENQEAVDERIIEINGEYVIVTISPLKHSEKNYGAVAIIKKYKDTETKQHILRKKLIGKGYKARYNFKDIIGRSENIIKCKNIAKRMAKSNSSILITGETGTGKELFAQAIHNNSTRKAYQFVPVNCGAFPENLLESELFGYEEGSFTGARKGGKPGLFELAHNGSLFLDEIAEMPMNLQVKLLRVLQEREVVRIGGDNIIDVDVRIIAATNKNIGEMVKNGEFRQDLYYRLNVLPLHIPPLRDRKEDILYLLQHVQNQFNASFSLSEKAKETLLGYNWDGNVRELRNYVEYLINLDSQIIEAKDLPFNSQKEADYNETIKAGNGILMDFLESTGKNIRKYIFLLEELQKAYIDNRRLGRRSIHRIAKSKGMFLSEQEIRTMLTELERLYMARVSKGRAGTVITKEGIEALEYLKMG